MFPPSPVIGSQNKCEIIDLQFRYLCVKNSIYNVINNTQIYNNEDLEYGVMLSVKITNKVKPIINVDALKETDVTVRPVLLKVAEIYFQTSLLIIKTYDKHSFRIV